MSEIRIIAFDVETTGAFLNNNELVSVGYCVGKSKYEIVEKGRIDFEVENEIEPRCYEEY